jgi:hypothetical protein
MQKVFDWEKKLKDVFEEWQTKTFIWSETDCCCFVAACIDAQTGMNFKNYIENKYKDKKTAQKYLKNKVFEFNERKFKASSLIDLANEFFGEPIAALMAQRGDLVLYEGDDVQFFSIVAFSGREIVAMQESGLIKLPLRIGTMAWRV